MPYGKSDDMNKLKKKIEEQMPGVDVDNLKDNDMKKMLVNEINKDNSIDPNIKEKINKGDIDGLKDDLINMLGRSKNPDSDKLAKMLKNNDMDGLKNQLMGMLLGGLNSQKKNEIISGDEAGEAESILPALPSLPSLSSLTSLTSIPAISSLLGENALLGSVMGKMYESNKNDNRVIFLNSMKPFVSGKRQKTIDDCIKIISALAFFEKFTNTNKVGS